MGSVKFLSRFLMFCSGILLLAGAAGLIAGIWMNVSPSSFQGVLGGIENVQPEQYLSYLLMAAGLVLLHVGVLGCCGAVRDTRCLWLLFFVVALMAVLVQVAGAVVGQWFPEEMTGLLGHRAVELIEENKVLTLSVFGSVTALEALSMASSMILYCTPKRRLTATAHV